MNKFWQLFDIKLWKYLLVGVINTLVGNGLQFLLYNLTDLQNHGQIGTWTATTISYFAGGVTSYFLNKYFTFKNTEKGIKPIIRFALEQIICYVIAYAIAIPTIMYICRANQWTMFGWEVDKFASNVSMIIGSCLFVAINYLGLRFFAFSNKKIDT